MDIQLFHLTDIEQYPHKNAIIQGSTLDWLNFIVRGDFSGWVPRGQIRNNYAGQGGVIKAEFSFDPLIYGTVILPSGLGVMGTLVKPKLSAAATDGLDWVQSGMRKRAFVTEKPIVNRNVWVYDVEIAKGAEVLRIAEGFVEVSLSVTRGG
jgi:hypothetical protein